MRTVIGEVRYGRVFHSLTDRYAADWDKFKVCEHGCSGVGRIPGQARGEAIENHQNTPRR